MRTPVIFDGRNIYQPRADEGARLHLLLDRTLTVARVLVTGGAGYIGSHAVRALRRRRPRGRRARQSVGRARRGAARRRAAGEARAIHDRAAVHRRAASSIAHRRGDALRGVARGRRLGARAARLLPEQRRRARWRVLEAMARRRRASASSSRRPARSTASRHRCRSSRRSTSGRSTPTARPSWRSSGRCRTSSGRTACSWIALRYFNAAGADPDGAIGEDHAPEIHLIPRAIEAADRRPAARRCSATTIRRRTAPACATTFTSPIWPTRTSARSRRSSAARASGAYNLGTGTPHSVKAGDRRGRAVVGRAGARGQPAPRRPGDPAVLYAASDRAQRELGWSAAIRRPRVIVRHAWHWHSDPSARVCSDAVAPIADGRFPAPAPLRDPAPRASSPARRWRWSSTAPRSAALACLIKPIIDDVCRAAAIAAVRRGGDPRRLPPQGPRRVLLQLPDGRRRAARRDGACATSCSATCSTSRRRSSRAARPGSCCRASTTTSARCSARSRRRSATWRANRSRWSASRRCCSTTTPGWRCSA